MDSSTNNSLTSPCAAPNASRLEALRQTGLLDSPPEKAFDRLTDLVRRLLDVPVVLLTLIDDHRQFFKSSCGLPEPFATRRETPLTHSLCKHVVATAKPLVVTNAPEDPIVRDNLALRDLGVKAYLGIPLSTPNGYVIGSLCAIDVVERNWSKDDVEVLSGLAASVMNEIAVRLHLTEIEAFSEEMRVKNATLEQYADELRTANATKDRFLSIIAHDLRGPLQNLILYADALVEETDGEPASTANRLSVGLDSAIRSMGRLLENLLQWSRVKTGHLRCNPQQFPIDSLLRDTLDFVASQADRKGVRLVSDFSSETSVVADPNMVSCIVHNLLTNAVKFTESGGCVRLTTTDLGDHVEIAVQDDGVGMPDEIVTCLFGLDQTTSRPGTDGENGTGLGLVLCRELVELNSGKIWARSRLGQGTRLCFTLPAVRIPETRQVA